jgi:hypothetical protein
VVAAKKLFTALISEKVSCGTGIIGRTNVARKSGVMPSELGASRRGIWFHVRAAVEPGATSRQEVSACDRAVLQYQKLKDERK